MTIHTFIQICVLAKMITPQGLNITLQMLGANTVDKNQEAMA